MVGALALFVLILILNFFGSGIKNGFYAASSPMQRTFWMAGGSCSGFLTSFANAGSLSKQNQNLQGQVQQLQSQLTAMQEVINGNQAQSTVSMACQNNGFKLLMAGVVGLSDQDIMSINKGSADGIKVNMPVINQQGALYGKISKVYKNFSNVMLISNKSSVISVKISQSDVAKPEIDGVVKGLGNQRIFLDLVPIDDTLNQGDLLVTSALENVFPKDLLVGTITKVQKNDQNPHQTAQIKPFLSSSIDNLFVITNYK